MPDRNQNRNSTDPESLLSNLAEQKALSELKRRLLAAEMEGFLVDMQVQIERMRASVDLLERADQLGLEMIYLNRRDALLDFLPYLEGYVKRPESKLYIVSSSLKGALEKMPVFADVIYEAVPRQMCPDGEENTENVLESSQKEFCVLLTHPWYSSFRENQEVRSPGDIADEIFQSIRKLREMGARDIKFYKGTPTCFLIATDERMLLNPYPYEKEAFESFCITVKKIVPPTIPGSIYEQYITNHFFAPWENLRGNALTYEYFELDGPIPGPEKRLEEGPDFFVIQDANEFYLAVFLRGKQGVPAAVEMTDTEEEKSRADRTATPELPKFVSLGDKFKLRLLRVRNNTYEWVPLKEVKYYFNEERRSGKILGKHPGEFEEFAMIGIFSDEDPPIENPHEHKEGWAHPDLKGQPLPLFWRWMWEKPKDKPKRQEHDAPETTAVGGQ